jgi:DNA-binding LytR/AlgR family response regulator
MKVKVLLVEDEYELALNIRDILEFSDYEVVGIFQNADDVISYLYSNDLPDLILMDILIQGDKDGIDLTYYIRDKYDIPIVFLTAYSDQSILERIAKVLYDGYILKPFNKERLISTVYLALEEFKSNKNKKRRTLNIREKGFIVPVPEEEIMFLQADGLYTKVITKSKKYVVRDILKDIGEKLSEDKFIRVHKSFLVNIDKIQSINSKEICIDDHVLPIRRGLYKPLKQLMNI